MFKYKIWCTIKRINVKRSLHLKYITIYYNDIIFMYIYRSLSMMIYNYVWYIFICWKLQFKCLLRKFHIVNFLISSGMEQFFFFFCCWELVEVTTLSPSMINTIPSVEEWDIKINSVKKEVGSIYFSYTDFT